MLIDMCIYCSLSFKVIMTFSYKIILMTFIPARYQMVSMFSFTTLNEGT